MADAAPVPADHEHQNRPPAPGARAVDVGRLATAAGPAAVLHGDPSTVVTSVSYDSRDVRPGGLFCCVPGQQADGHAFAQGAVVAGASALLVEHRLAVDVAQIEVPDARAAMAAVATEFWGHPSTKVAVVGVTGTNGKTTVTHLLASIVDAAGRRAEVIGTLSGSRTTPEAPDLQARLAASVAAGIDVVAMEVSSHALVLHRVDGTRFAVSAFTNLGRDHLDFHGTTEAYFAAKATLFEPGRTARAVVNIDDPHGRLLRDAALVDTVGFSLAEASDLQLRATGSSFVWRGEAMEIGMAGRHNVANALCAAHIAAALGFDVGHIAAGLAAAGPVPGRFELIEAGQPYTVVVDYAHTPDALERVLEAARELVENGCRLIVVFGCGGDRDPTKRAPMGAVASRLADLSVLTSDNPRQEPPLAIINQVRSGVVAGADFIIDADRRSAIRRAFAQARPGDVVVIAGKGHETTQTIGDTVLAFDDRVVARELLSATVPPQGAGAP